MQGIPRPSANGRATPRRGRNGRATPRRGCNGRDALLRVRCHAGRVTLPMRVSLGAPAAQPRTRQARQSAFADAKERVAAHLRASSKRVAPPFRPFGPDAPAGHERPLSRDTNFVAFRLPGESLRKRGTVLIV